MLAHRNSLMSDRARFAYERNRYKEHYEDMLAQRNRLMSERGRKVKFFGIQWLINRKKK